MLHDPTVPKSKFFVTLNLFGSFQRELDEAHLELDPKANERIPSHITLVPPFSSQRAVSVIAYHMEVSSARFRPFFVMPQGVDPAFPNREVMALKLAPAQHIGRIAKHMAQQLRPLMGTDGRARVSTMQKRTFRPHITMARRSVLRDTDEAAARLNERFVNRPVLADGALLWRLDKAVWQPCEHICFPR